VPQGAVTTLLGPNGAGKSTMVLAVGGVLRPTGGEVSLAGTPLTKLRPERIRQAGVAIVPEGRRLLPELTVQENLRVATYSLSREDAKTGIEYAIELFPHLETRWNAVARTLSGGEQQMVVLAQALVSRPKFMLVDELSLGLAPVVVQRLIPALQEAASQGVGVLRPTAGRILLGDQDLTKRRPEVIRGAGVAVVPEGRRLLPDLSVADNLRIATYSLSKADAEAGKRYALELFPELKRRWDTAARSLSGGEQQMVVLAQALAARPSILLVDELSLGLAPVIVKRLVPTLAEVAARGVGVLLIEQFAHVALRLANRAYILEGGRIRYDGTAGELKAKPELLHSAYLLRA